MQPQVDLKKFHKVLFVFNRNSGKQLFASMLSRINQTVNGLRVQLPQAEIELYSLKRFAEMPGLADRVRQEKIDWVIIGGGDGTIRAFIEELLTRQCYPYISVFPAGTINLIARELQLSKEPQKWLHRVNKGIVEPVYIGKANGNIFLTVAGVGFDSMVVDKVSILEKKLLSTLAYVVQSTDTMRRELLFSNWRYTFKVQLDDDPVWYDASSIIVGKSRYYAGRYNLFSEAALKNPYLYAAIFTGHKRTDFVRYATSIALESLTLNKNIMIKKAKRIEIRCVTKGAEDCFPVELDGDAVTETPLRLEIVEPPLQFLV